MTFPMEWYLLFLVCIPQVYLGLLLGLKVFNLNLNWRRLLIISIIGGLLIYAIRRIPMIFGLPSIFDFLILVFLLSFIGKIKFSQALCSTMAAIMLIAVAECGIVALCFNITGVTFMSLQTHQLLMFWFFVPEALFFLGLYYLVRRTHFTMWDLNKL